MMQIERCFDFLESLRGKRVSVTIKAYKEYTINGILLCWDSQKNIILRFKNEDNDPMIRFINGDNVLFVEVEDGNS